MKLKLHQRGLGAIVVLVVLVLLASIAAAVLRLSVAQSQTSAAQVDLSRALAAARSGIQWGAHQALKGSWSTCAGAVQNLDLSANTDFKVTVSCTSAAYNEGESAPGVAQTVRLFTIKSVACNGAQATCPDATSVMNAGYVERELQASFRQ